MLEGFLDPPAAGGFVSLVDAESVPQVGGSLAVLPSVMPDLPSPSKLVIAGDLPSRACTR